MDNDAVSSNSFNYSVPSCAIPNLLIHFGYSNCRSWKKWQKGSPIEIVWATLIDSKRKYRYHSKSWGLLFFCWMLSFSRLCKYRKSRKATIVDLCSGNGAVAFLLSHKAKNHITAVEIQEQLWDMAMRTNQLNDLEDRITFINQDIRQLKGIIPKDSVDFIITCNPPYFKVKETNQTNLKEAYTIARHEVHLPLEDLLRDDFWPLKMKGKAYLVHRPDRLTDILTEARHHRLEAKRVQFVYPKEGKESNIVLIELMKGRTSWWSPRYCHQSRFSMSIKNIPRRLEVSSGGDNAWANSLCMSFSARIKPFIRAIRLDLEKRIATHNAGKGAKYTKVRTPVTLLYAKEFATSKKPWRRKQRLRNSPLKKETFLQTIGATVTRPVIIYLEGEHHHETTELSNWRLREIIPCPLLRLAI